jgi:hypothetical protein
MARRQIAGVKVPKALGNTAKGVLANPLTRELLAATLVHAAAMLIESQSTKGSATRRMVSGLGDASKRAGKLGSTTIDQALDTLRDYWNKSRSDGAPAERQQERPRRPRQSKRSKRSGGADKSAVAKELPTIP